MDRDTTGRNKRALTHSERLCKLNWFFPSFFASRKTPPLLFGSNNEYNVSSSRFSMKKKITLKCTWRKNNQKKLKLLKKDRLISYLGSELICHGNFSVHCHSDTILWSWGEAKGQKCDACDNLSFSFAWRGEVQCQGDFFLENEWKFYENEQLWRPRDGARWCENLRHLVMVNSNSQLTQNNLQHDERWKHIVDWDSRWVRFVSYRN